MKSTTYRFSLMAATLIGTLGAAGCGGEIANEVDPDAGGEVSIAPTFDAGDTPMTTGDAATKPYSGSIGISQIGPSSCAFNTVDINFDVALGEFDPFPADLPSPCIATLVPLAPNADAGRSASASSPPTKPVPVAAGTITIADGNAPITTLLPENTGSGIDYSAANPPTESLTWKDGDGLWVSASGDQVHAFKVLVVGSGPFEERSLPSAGPVTIPSAGDFVISWTPSPVIGAIVYVNIAMTQSPNLSGSDPVSGRGRRWSGDDPRGRDRIASCGISAGRPRSSTCTGSASRAR